MLCLLQADVAGSGQLGAEDAAKFLKKSSLSDSVLHEVNHAIRELQR